MTSFYPFYSFFQTYFHFDCISECFRFRSLSNTAFPVYQSTTRHFSHIFHLSHNRRWRVSEVYDLSHSRDLLDFQRSPFVSCSDLASWNTSRTNITGSSTCSSTSRTIRRATRTALVKGAITAAGAKAQCIASSVKCRAKQHVHRHSGDEEDATCRCSVPKKGKAAIPNYAQIRSRTYE